jgi:hypothetical protein
MTTVLIGLITLVIGLAVGMGLGQRHGSYSDDSDNPIIARRQPRTEPSEVRQYVPPSRYTSAPMSAHAPPTAESDPAE